MGGNNRSHIVAQVYYCMRTQNQIENDYKGYFYQLMYNMESGYLPGKKYMEKFMTDLACSLGKNTTL